MADTRPTDWYTERAIQSLSELNDAAKAIAIDLGMSHEDGFLILVAAVGFAAAQHSIVKELPLSMSVGWVSDGLLSTAQRHYDRMMAEMGRV